jgi:hypothetical protein
MSKLQNNPNKLVKAETAVPRLLQKALLLLDPIFPTALLPVIPLPLLLRPERLVLVGFALPLSALRSIVRPQRVSRLAFDATSVVNHRGALEPFLLAFDLLIRRSLDPRAARRLQALVVGTGGGTRHFLSLFVCVASSGKL